ncbi:MAG TPA: response regulator transcription factor [Solirubrobacteraceae bacterium]|jgi:DNA-binding NarL/FixJ family response regulator|nr:response regulator transcription factor [Solirubrobacteraceae bacterium]
MTAVLIVDDAPADRELLARIVRHAGYAVLEAGNGERALHLARTRRPALLVADILMPTMDGYELVRGLRDDEATAGIPVIFYTATYVIDEVRRLAAACGVSHILVKPAKPEAVIAAIEHALSASPDVAPLPSEDFHREHLRLVSAKLLEKVEELRETVILAGTLQRESDQVDGFGPWPVAGHRTEIESILSRRELQVLGMIVDGASNNEIAERLVIATSTVQSHVKRILHKLGVRNRTEAAVRYLRR